MKLVVGLLLLSGWVVAPAWATPVCWTLQPAESHLTFTGDQAGAPAHGEFKAFKVDFCFDPASASGRFRAVIDVGSLDTHNSRRDSVLKGPEFLAIAQYPQAIYAASQFARAGDGTFTAEGTLTLHGVSRPVPVTFSFTLDGAAATVTGKATLQRMDFKVGMGRWTNTRWVGNAVELSFVLYLVRVREPLIHQGLRHPGASRGPI